MYESQVLSTEPEEVVRVKAWIIWNFMIKSFIFLTKKTEKHVILKKNIIRNMGIIALTSKPIIFRAIFKMGGDVCPLMSRLVNKIIIFIKKLLSHIKN